MSSRSVKTIKDGAVLTANDLSSGSAVFLTSDSTWSESLDDAWVAKGQDDLVLLQTRASDAEISDEIVSAYVIDTDSQGFPNHLRERLRINGPSVVYGGD